MLRWGIIGTGGIAHRFAQSLGVPEAASCGRVRAVLSRTQAGAAAFAKEFSLPRAYDRMEDLLADKEVDAVYVATPHPMHAEAVQAAARTKKHILCEKPMAMNAAQTRDCVAAAKEAGVFLTEAFTYRVSAQTQKLRALMASGIVGEVRYIGCDFVFRSEKQPARLTEKHLGGGALLDLGCYAMSLARLTAGAAQKRAFAEPDVCAGRAQFAPNGIDTASTAFLQFAGGPYGYLSCGFAGIPSKRLSVLGSEGRIEMDEPFFSRGRIRVGLGKNPRELIFDFTNDSAERFATLAARIDACVQDGKIELPEMTWADSLGNAAALDAWRAKIGLAYEADGNTK